MVPRFLSRSGFLVIVSQLAFLTMGFCQVRVEGGEMHSKLQNYVAERVAEFDQIPEFRKLRLQEISKYIQDRVHSTEPVQLTFICTHNSRRSHMAQLWAVVAASRYGIPNLRSYSGGTEATAFNPRSVAAMERAGFKISIQEVLKNPHYLVSIHEDGELLECFSKVYDASPNPKFNFCAVMTCSSADEACPLVPGADARISIPYADPKVADDTAEESARYDERSAQIAREMLYVFAQVQLK